MMRDFMDQGSKHKEPELLGLLRRNGCVADSCVRENLDIVRVDTVGATD
jgi:hypothetical protein